MTISNTIAGMVSFGATVSGVNGSYDLKTFADAVAAGNLATLPVLLAVPKLDRQSGFESLGMMGQSSRVTFSLEHYLLYERVDTNADITLIMPSLVTAIDNYFAALKANPFLTGTTAPAYHHVPKVPFMPAVKTLWGGAQYHSIVFLYENVELNL